MGQTNFWHETGIGQIIMTGLPGPDLDSATRRLIKKFGISNFIIFSRNATAGPGRLSRLCNEIKAACRSQGLFPLIAVDQEGGPVRRLKPPLFPDMGSAADVVCSPDPLSAMKELAERTAKILGSVGINMNLAPVLDLCLEAEKHVLRGRCFGNMPYQVAELGRTYIETLQERGLLATAKHFPGIGGVRLDPHLERPVVEAPEEDIAAGIVPFREAVEADVAAVMTSHVVFTSIDAGGPATFSKKIATDILRNDLGFNGLLLSDDLEMKGITKHGKIGHAAVDAFLAGHDLLLICSKQRDVLESLEYLRRALDTGRISGQRLQTSRERIRKAAAGMKQAD